jgi:hypothetical protein
MQRSSQDTWPKYETPGYLQEPEFKEFLKSNQVQLNEGTGYMFVRLEKDNPSVDTNSVYYGGEIVRGSLFFELFHQSLQNEIFFRLRGVLIKPKKRYSMHEKSSEGADIYRNQISTGKFDIRSKDTPKGFSLIIEEQDGSDAINDEIHNLEDTPVYESQVTEQ